MMDGFLHVQLLSMINAIKTGDPTVDMFLAMILPYLVGQVFSKDLVRWILRLVSRFFQTKRPAPPIQERTISHRTQRTSAGAMEEMDRDNYNLILIKAIQLYVDKNCHLELQQAEVDLTTLETSRLGNATAHQPHACSRGRGSNAPTPTSALLQTFEFIERPLPKRFYNVGTFEGNNVSMKLEDSINGGGGGKSGGSSTNDPEGSSSSGGNQGGVRSMQITLRSSSKESIRSFIETAYQWYTEQLVTLENHDRYYFDLKSFETRHNSRPNFRRYKLGDEKTFETLFSRQCHRLRTIVDQFESKTGRYRIKGYPHKLGLLLSGLPGTGKTSLIKALSHYLDRHIVNIPLSRISTNAELMALLFNTKYALDDTGVLSDLDFKQVIFVLEDVDAGSPVVKSRALIAAEEEEAKRQEAEEGATKKSKKNKVVTGGSAAPRAADTLNLTGLLNALDGVVETPGRIVIMSTNHPELLDPALTRPGRIDKHLVMGYMIPEDMVAMINHYYETQMSHEQEKQLQILVVKEKLETTAAQLECWTAEYDNVEDLLEALWGHSRLARKNKKGENEDEEATSSCCTTTADVSSDTSSDSPSLWS